MNYEIIFDTAIIGAAILAIIWISFTLIAVLKAGSYDKKMSDAEQEAFLEAYKIEKGRKYYDRKTKKKH